METKSFPGSLPNLFLASDILLDNVAKRLPQFNNLKKYYDQAYLESLRTELRNAEKMPDDAARSLWHQSARTNVVDSAAVCLTLFRGLKRYTFTAFPIDTQNYYDSMGIGAYSSASNQSWDSCKSLCTSMINFIAAHLGALTANENMDAEYQQTVIDAALDFNTKLLTFYQQEERAKTSANDRNTACGEIYKKIISCGLDGQYIFESNETIRKEYSFEAISDMISPKTAAGMIVETSRDENGVSVQMPGVEISIIGTDKTGTTNAEGITEFTQLPETTLKIKAKADGYEDRIIDFNTEAGVTRRLKIVMVPLFEGEMNVGTQENTPQAAAATTTNNS
ncbi:MAG: carboxypeptidase-like regulatory domain-containing protein [Bacteroidota bacterium]